MRIASWGYLLCVLCGCSEPAATRATAGESVRDGFFMTADAPAPLACAVDSDCHGDTIPDATNPCCNDPRSLRAYSRAYKTWIQEWRGEHCESVTCPPPPLPSIPPDCRFEVRCVRGQCADTCR
ncbi:MAG: hypothetical protein AAGE52_27455 [Myxococcota bacterium]